LLATRLPVECAQRAAPGPKKSPIKQNKKGKQKTKKNPTPKVVKENIGRKFKKKKFKI
jgi:hypothetical protein